MEKLLATGKTDLLDKFVSMRTRRAFKAFLAWDKEAGKVNFEFEPRTSKFPPRKTRSPAAPRRRAGGAAQGGGEEGRGQEGAGEEGRSGEEGRTHRRRRARPAPA